MSELEWGSCCCFTLVEVATHHHQLHSQNNSGDITKPNLTSEYERMLATTVAVTMGVPSGQEVPS